MKLSSLKSPVVFLTALVALSVWLAVFYLPAQARKEWETTRQELLARGEKLAIANFVPPSVPDERNFFADPLWTEMAEREVDMKWDVVPYHKARKPDKDNATYVLRSLLDETDREALEKEFPEFRSLAKEDDRLMVLKTTWKKAEKAGDTTRAGAYVLKALAPSEAIIARFGELAERPEASFPLEYQEGALMDVPHIVVLLRAASWLNLRALVLLSQGRSDEAFRDAKLIFRLAETFRSEPILISLLTEGSIVKIGAEVIQRGIQLHAWNDAQLREFDRQAKMFDLTAQLAVCLRFERAVMIESTIPLAGKLGSQFVSFVAGLPESRDLQRYPASFLHRVYYLPADESFYARAIQRWVEALDQVPSQAMKAAAFPDTIKERSQTNPSKVDALRLILSRLSLPSLGGAITRVANLQTIVLQARVAIALERYRLKTGAYPDTLEVLVPEFLPKMPLDLVTRRPFFYRREETGDFTLWSVGWNETDEGGTAARKALEGDWVWGK